MIERLIGFDISPSETGITIMDRSTVTGALSLVYVTTIQTVSSKGTGSKKITFTDGERLKIIRDATWEILEKFNPQVFVKEGQGADMNKFRSVSLVSKATGVIEECIQSWENDKTVELHSYPPSTVKKSVTGYGGVDKSIKGSDAKAKYLRKKPVIDAVLERFGTTMYTSKIRKLKGDTEAQVYWNDNECDSTAVILTHLEKEDLLR